MAYNGIERRRWPRVKLNLPLKYRGVGEFNHLPMDSETRDISEGGIRFTSERFIPKDSKLVVNLNLSDLGGVKATVRIVWAARDPHTNRYEVGAEFDTLPPEAKVQIANLVRRHL
jgi:c-di-GMP-binding flagellar brake protein YcgR